MRSERGASNINKYNAEREQQYLFLIHEALKKCKKGKMQFKSLGNLAEHIDSVTDIDRTTLTRNPRYRLLLVEHLAGQKGAYGAVSDEDAAPERLRARLLATHLEISNLKAEVKRLTACVKRAEELPALADSSSPNIQESNKDYVAFVDTAMALAAVLNRLKATVTIDLKNKTIEDLAAKPSLRVIIGPDRTGPFIDWLREHQSFLLNFIQKQ
ncbi:MAG: hypothetical protein Q8K12_13055 [Thiobacillus sp.]|nr:hypothetical protein [Thiobacillus sp.]